MFRAVILIRQIVAPVALTYGLNKRLDTIIARMKATTKTATYRIPHVIKDLVTLIMEHCRHFLSLRRHQHSWNINAPAVRNEKNDLLVVATHLINDFQTFPVNAIHNFLRPFQRQFSHHRHRLWRSGIHGINNGLPLCVALFRETVVKINLRAATGTFT